MSGMQLASGIFLIALTGFVQEVKGQDLALNGNYRVEVFFTSFENRRSTIANGKYCDTFTKCDPMFYSFVDFTKPFEQFPGAGVWKQEYELFARERDTDVFGLGKTIKKNICYQSRLPERVTVRVEVLDHDYLTKNDLLEQFDCSFQFRPTRRDQMFWSDFIDCTPIHQRNGIRLSYLWRIFPIDSRECGSTSSLVPVPTTTTTTSASTTTATTTITTTTTPMTTTTETTTTPTNTTTPTTTTTESSTEATTEISLETSTETTAETTEIPSLLDTGFRLDNLADFLEGRIRNQTELFNTTQVAVLEGEREETVTLLTEEYEQPLEVDYLSSYDSN